MSSGLRTQGRKNADHYDPTLRLPKKHKQKVGIGRVGSVTSVSSVAKTGRVWGGTQTTKSVDSVAIDQSIELSLGLH